MGLTLQDLGCCCGGTPCGGGSPCASGFFCCFSFACADGCCPNVLHLTDSILIPGGVAVTGVGGVWTYSLTLPYAPCGGNPDGCAASTATVQWDLSCSAFLGFAGDVTVTTFTAFGLCPGPSFPGGLSAIGDSPTFTCPPSLLYTGTTAPMMPVVSNALYQIYGCPTGPVTITWSP